MYVSIVSLTSCEYIHWALFNFKTFGVNLSGLLHFFSLFCMPMAEGEEEEGVGYFWENFEGLVGFIKALEIDS